MGDNEKKIPEQELKGNADTIKKIDSNELDLPEEVRPPHLYEAIISFLGIVIVMSVGIVIYGVDPHIPMFIGVIIAALVSMKIGYKWQDIEGMMIHGISMAMQAILILCIVGMMIGVWILSRFSRSNPSSCRRFNSSIPLRFEAIIPIYRGCVPLSTARRQSASYLCPLVITTT